jgi:hypothetical protein
MKKAAAMAIAVLCVLAPTAALAEQSWCAVVNPDLPGGFLNVRDAPSADSDVRYQLHPGDLMYLLTGHHESGWGLVDNAYTTRDGGRNFDVLNADGENVYAGTFGWARDLDFSQVECPYDWSYDANLTAPALGEYRRSAGIHELPKDDAYYACLVGNGAVVLVHQATVADAFDKAVEACAAEAVGASTVPAGDIGDTAHGVEDAAYAALQQLAPDDALAAARAEVEAAAAQRAAEEAAARQLQLQALPKP